MSAAVKKKTVRVRFCGFGGQGVVLAGRILAEAFSTEYKFVSQAASYGPEARGSACRADVIASDSFIQYPRIEEADWLVALSQKGYDKYLSMLASGGGVIFDSGLVKPHPVKGTTQHGIPLGSIAEKYYGNRQNINIAAIDNLIKISYIININKITNIFKITKSDIK